MHHTFKAFLSWQPTHGYTVQCQTKAHLAKIACGFGVNRVPSFYGIVKCNRMYTFRKRRTPIILIFETLNEMFYRKQRAGKEQLFVFDARNRRILMVRVNFSFKVSSFFIYFWIIFWSVRQLALTSALWPMTRRVEAGE